MRCGGRLADAALIQERRRSERIRLHIRIRFRLRERKHPSDT
jgi:hypothetical protein